MIPPEHAREEWSRLLGGLLSAKEAAERLDLSESDLRALTDVRELIVVRDQEGHDLYPGFQFRSGLPPESLLTACAMIAAAADPWTACSWAVTPDPALTGLAPVEWVVANPPASLLRVARHDAARLAR